MCVCVCLCFCSFTLDSRGLADVFSLIGIVFAFVVIAPSIFDIYIRDPYMGPYGPIWDLYWAHMGTMMGTILGPYGSMFGPIWGP
jgi:hypothetical protein